MRFWTYHRGWVRLTIKPGQELTVSTCGRTEEGYSYRHETFTFDGKNLFSHVEDGGRDCDGRHASSDSYICDHIMPAEPPSDLDPDGRPACPHWQRIPGSSRNYDQFAEAAGY